MNTIVAGRLLAVAFVIGFATSCTRTAAESFPQVDRSKLRISLTRSACFGTCPDYKVTIEGNGQVIFSTREYSLSGAARAHREFSASSHVVWPGKHVDQIDVAAVDALVDQFRSANFFSLKDAYQAQITDNPTYEVEIDTGYGRKRVIDYVGLEAGMPKAVKELESAIDKTSGSARWVNGADGLIEALKKDKFDFHSDAAARVLLAAVEHGGDETLVDLVRLGTPLDKTVNGQSFGSAALLASIEYGRVLLFQALVDQGWLVRTKSSDVNQVFAGFAAGCNPAMVDVAVHAGVPVDATTDPNGEDMGIDGGGTALASVGHGFLCDEDSSKIIAVAKRLLANGADPNKRDVKGETPIFGVEVPALLDMLLAAGADPKAVDRNGNSAVFGSWTDDIVFRLLQAGASPRGHYEDGKTLWEQMREHPIPKSKAWLEAHPSALAEAKSS